MSLVDDLYKKEEQTKKKEPVRTNIVDPIVIAIKEKVIEDFARREFKGYLYQPFQEDTYYIANIDKVNPTPTFKTEKSLTEAGYTPPTFNDFIEEVTIRAKEEIGVKEFFLMLEPGIYKSIPVGGKKGLFDRNVKKFHVLYIYMEAKW